MSEANEFCWVGEQPPPRFIVNWESSEDGVVSSGTISAEVWEEFVQAVAIHIFEKEGFAVLVETEACEDDAEMWLTVAPPGVVDSDAFFDLAESGIDKDLHLMLGAEVEQIGEGEYGEAWTGCARMGEAGPEGLGLGLG